MADDDGEAIRADGGDAANMAPMQFEAWLSTEGPGR
jgi:hypothetical protein